MHIKRKYTARIKKDIYICSKHRKADFAILTLDKIDLKTK